MPRNVSHGNVEWLHLPVAKTSRIANAHRDRTRRGVQLRPAFTEDTQQAHDRNCREQRQSNQLLACERHAALYFRRAGALRGACVIGHKSQSGKPRTDGASGAELRRYRASTRLVRSVARRRRLTVRTSNAVIVIALANDAIARARRVLQSNAIDDVDAAMPILDEAGLLQHARGDGYTGATNAQHESQKFLCERKFVSGDAV